MSRPLFSICIPNYNYAQYIGETIQSVLAQTCQDFEIIVADNASTDDSIGVVEQINDERIRIIRNRYNIGFAPNLQRASEPARGKHMLMLSSDDRMLPEALETYKMVLINLGENAQHSLVLAESLMIDGKGQVLPNSILQPEYYSHLSNSINTLPTGLEYELYKGIDVLRLVTRRLCAIGPFLSTLYSRKLYEAVQGYNGVHLTDPDTHFSHKLMSQEPQVVWVRQSLFEYRVHESNQLGQQIKQASIKKPIDKYLLTLETPQSVLDRVGLQRKDLQLSFIYRYCVNESFHYLAHGAYAQAWKGLMFGITTYPGAVFRTPRAYVLAALLVLGPLAPAATRLVRDVFRFLGGNDE